MAGAVRVAASRTVYFGRELRRVCTPTRLLVRQPLFNPISTQLRLMSILETYVEKPEKKEKKMFVNPLKQPKLKEVSTDDIEILLSRYDCTEPNDLPIEDLPHPYKKPQRKCIICEHDVQLDYKNTRLLSQFVSPHTGQIYGRHITGLCIYMQKRVAKLIKRARYFGFMPYIYKEPRFLEDPKLFDPFKRVS